MTSLEVRGLCVGYGAVSAVDDVSFRAEPGEPVAVLGRNGAGKSSLLAAIAGLVRPSAGRVLLGGRDITALPAERRARASLALVPEGRRIFPRLTVEENLRLGGFWSGRDRRDVNLARVVGLFPVLGQRLGSPAGQLSGGEQQMVAVGRALMSEPQVLLLDEPSLGLAPAAVAEVYAQLRILQAEGLTLLLVEQQVRRALDFAADAIVLDAGRVAAHDVPDRLLEDPRLFNAYMGTRPR